METCACFVFGPFPHKVGKIVTMGTENQYPGFEYPAKDLSAHILSIGKLIISQSNGSIVDFSPKNTEDFERWLSGHGVRNLSIRDEKRYHQKAIV